MTHLTENELAARWKKSPRTLRQWREEGIAPPYFKAGAKILYPLVEIEKFEQQKLKK